MADENIATLGVAVEIDTSGTEGAGAKVAAETDTIKTSMKGMGTTSVVSGAQTGTAMKGIGTAMTGTTTKTKLFTTMGRLMGPMLRGMGVPAQAVGPAFRGMGAGAEAATPGIEGMGASMAVALAPIVAITVAITAVTAALNYFKKKAEEQAKNKQMQGYFQNVFGDLQGSQQAVESFASSIGKNAADVEQDIANLGTTFRVMGLSAQDAMTMSMGIEQLASSASKLRPDLDFSSALDAVQTAIRGTASDLATFGIIMTEADRQNFALQNGLWDQSKAWDTVTQQLVNYNILIQKFGSWANIMAGNTGNFSLLTGVYANTKKDAQKIDDTVAGVGLAGFDKLNNINKQTSALDTQAVDDTTDAYANMGDALFYSNSQLQQLAANDAAMGNQHRTIWNKIADAGGGAWATISNAGGTAWASLKNVAVSAWTTISDVGGTAWATVSNVGGTAWATIKSVAAPFLGEVWTGITAAAGSAWGSITNIAGTAWGGITTAAGAAWGAITEAGGRAIGFITGLINNLWTAIGSVIGIFQTAIDSIFGFIRTLIDNVMKIVQPIIDTVTKFVDKVSGFIGGAVDTVKNIGGKVLGFFGLADGGVALPRNPGLVTVGDNMTQPEIVAPMSYIRDAVADAINLVMPMGPTVGGTGSDIMIDAPIQLDGVTLGRLMYKYVNAENQRITGGAPIAR